MTWTRQQAYRYLRAARDDAESVKAWGDTAAPDHAEVRKTFADALYWLANGPDEPKTDHKLHGDCDKEWRAIMADRQHPLYSLVYDRNHGDHQSAVAAFAAVQRLALAMKDAGAALEPTSSGAHGGGRLRSW